MYDDLRLTVVAHILRYLLVVFSLHWMVARGHETSRIPAFYGLEKRLPSRRLHLVFA
jgi:hypothetical protein